MDDAELGATSPSDLDICDDDGDNDGEDEFVESKQPGDIHLHNPGLVQQHLERGSTF